MLSLPRGIRSASHPVAINITAATNASWTLLGPGEEVLLRAGKALLGGVRGELENILRTLKNMVDVRIPNIGIADEEDTFHSRI